MPMRRRAQDKKATHAIAVVISVTLAVIASACEQDFKLTVLNADGNSSNPNDSSNPGGGGPVVNVASSTETVPLAQVDVKKIDFLFVIDNSGSMKDNQLRISKGFEAFAETFYRRSDLDICTAIITSDRHLGRFKSTTYSRERILSCSRPANADTKTPAEIQAHVDQVIAEFKTQINVGIDGSGNELLGKSLITFLYNMNTWSTTINTANRTQFFRKDAVANISIVTDENNWFFKNPAIAESINDLPASTNAKIYNADPVAYDARMGIKEHLDTFFSLQHPDAGLSYSVVSLLELTKENTSDQGVAMNFLGLSDLVGRESSKGDIGSEPKAFTDLYQSVATGLVERADAVHLTHDFYKPGPSSLKVVLVKANGSRTTLSQNSDYTLLQTNGLTLRQELKDDLAPGDTLEVTYDYLLP